MPRTSESASLHATILAEVERNILSGQWPPGFRIPSELEMAEHYGCSRMTVNKVLTQLARAGLLERRRKAGSFVMRPNSRSAVLEIQDIRSEVLATGRAYRMQRLLRKRQLSRRTDMQALRLSAPVPVLRVSCLHHAGAQPFCLEERLINLEAVPAAEAESFEDLSPGAWLVQNVSWSSAEHRFRAEAASARAAALLGLKPQAPCLVIERRTWTEGQPVTHVRLSYPARAHELVAYFSPSTAQSRP